jgi:hypothetical protein
MRWFIIVFGIIFFVVFIGGAINVGEKPIFGHIDSILGTTALMRLHYVTFSLLYRGEHSLGEGLDRTDEDLRDFSKRPMGFDKAKKYRTLDSASDY